MRATLEWATLLVCCVALLLRVPDAVRGRNRTVFGILFLGTLCSVLAVSELYEVIDDALGGWDLTGLILRYLVFATVLLVGLRVTSGLADARAHQLIAGGIGRWALGLGCLAVTVAFFLMNSYGAPAGLQAQAAGGAGDADLAPWFTAAGRTYPAFVSLVLVAPLLAAVRGRLPRTVRAPALTPPSWVGTQHFVNYAAALGYVLGLVVFWFSGLIAGPPGNARATLRQKRG